ASSFPSSSIAFSAAALTRVKRSAADTDSAVSAASISTSIALYAMSPPSCPQVTRSGPHAPLGRDGIDGGIDPHDISYRERQRPAFGIMRASKAVPPPFILVHCTLQASGPISIGHISKEHGPSHG